jgi:ABC-type bacteriocin/lantibiotic exporter with double-glycine peptidase domain
MKNVIDFLTGNPVIFGIAVIVSLMIVFSFAKRIIHFILVLIAIAVLYIAWVTWHGGNPVEKATKAEQSVKGAVHKGDGMLKTIQGLFKHDEPAPRKDRE